MKKYNQAPLPFQGQKRRFLTTFKQALNSFSKDAIYVDLFGGSGLLAHTVKQQYQETKVIWNDYDNYLLRLEAIPNTNALLDKLRPLMVDLPQKERLPESYRNRLLQVVKTHEKEYGYVDYITLSASLLFSAKYATTYEQLAKETMYNKIKRSDYEAIGYMEGVERVQEDYKTLWQEYKNTKVVYLVDPPYLSTDVSTYGSKDYWRLRDYLDVLNVLDGSNYFYFTSNKSQIVELCEWIETRTFTGNPFKGATVSTTSNKLNHSAGYTDIMLYNYIESPD